MTRELKTRPRETPLDIDIVRICPRPRSWHIQTRDLPSSFPTADSNQRRARLNFWHFYGLTFPRDIERTPRREIIYSETTRDGDCRRRRRRRLCLLMNTRTTVSSRIIISASRFPSCARACRSSSRAGRLIIRPFRTFPPTSSPRDAINSFTRRKPDYAGETYEVRVAETLRPWIVKFRPRVARTLSSFPPRYHRASNRHASRSDGVIPRYKFFFYLFNLFFFYCEFPGRVQTVRRAGERVGTHTRVSAGIPGLYRVQSSAPVLAGEYLLSEDTRVEELRVKILPNFARLCLITRRVELTFFFLSL